MTNHTQTEQISNLAASALELAAQLTALAKTWPCTRERKWMNQKAKNLKQQAADLCLT